MTFQTGSRNDRGAAGSRFASAEELHTLSDKFASHDQQLQEILRLLRAQATPSSFIATTPVIQDWCVFYSRCLGRAYSGRGDTCSG
ncbi:hypothetical protein Scep_023623 [Stephania cephalantha]|uniref:Uncharacterized protein n=1 Tax=Stephania cephalantha TaxID=152367 RepID=A0AAP0F262_9MAGN